MCVQILLSESLNRREHMPPFVGTMAVDVELAECAVTQHLAERAEALPQNLLPVSDEQQARVAHLLPQSLEVQCRDDRLAGAGRGHDQVAMPTMAFSFDGQLLEHLALVRPRRHVEKHRAAHHRGVRHRGHRRIEARRIPSRVVVLILRTLPVGVEGGVKLSEDVG